MILERTMPLIALILVTGAELLVDSAIDPCKRSKKYVHGILIF